MTIPFLPHITPKEREKMRLKLTRVTLENVIEEVQISEKLLFGRERSRQVTLTFKFLPKKVFKQKYYVTPSKILNFFEKKYVGKILCPAIAKAMQTKLDLVSTETGANDQVTSRSNDEENDQDDENDKTNKKMTKFSKDGEEHASSDEEDMNEDADATEAKAKNRHRVIK